ncbi:MAG: o-succinylbenzoate synthase [Verrucomicrobia bacterium]|nr:o-succinylbenzoate synthase [Verrucomicrobiota bacterium]
MTKCRFQFRRYRLPFRTAVRTAHGAWTAREGLVVRVQGEGGEVGWGEAAPIPWFGTETIDEAETACREIGEWGEAERLESVPERLRCVRNAIAAALREVGQVSDLPSARGDSLPAGKGRVEDPPYLSVAALLPAGRAVLGAIPPRAEAGFRVFKWKVGVGDVADELALLDDVCAALPEGAKLRLDANGAWDRRKAERWLERCAERPVEFVEQPCFAPPGGATQGTALLKQTEDLLKGLAGDFPTPLALDESIASDTDVERWLGAGWPGVFVVKPSLLGDVADTLARLERTKAAVVFSSALETAVGARAALRAAFGWPGEQRALGFGVWPLFADARFDGPAAAPFVRREDVERIDPEAVWNALS